MRARVVCFLIFCGSLCAQQLSQPSITIYNQDFAVVRQEIPLDLKSGTNQINVNDITMQLEPDSVILRDPAGKHLVNVLEQNYRADPVSHFRCFRCMRAGRSTLSCLITHRKRQSHPQRICTPRLFRHERYGNGYNPGYAAQQEEAIIEVGGQLRFSLPGTPVFPDLTGGDNSEAAPGMDADDR